MPRPLETWRMSSLEASSTACHHICSHCYCKLCRGGAFLPCCCPGIVGRYVSEGHRTCEGCMRNCISVWDVASACPICPSICSCDNSCPYWITLLHCNCSKRPYLRGCTGTAVLFGPW